jgi:putative ABC transport system substrate-binding protein
MTLVSVVGLVFALAALIASPNALAQEKTHRLGVISVSAASIELTAARALPMLAKEGFVSGRNLTMIGRHGPIPRLADLMQELLASKPDVVLAIGGDAILAASRATTSVPIVAYGPDPVTLGLAESMARPGRNVTGVVILPIELDGKRLALLQEALPGARPLAALVHPSSPNRDASEREVRATASAAGLDLRLFYAAGPQDYATAFAAMRSAGVRGAAVLANPEFYRDRALIARHALAARIPAICQWAEMAAEGCMLSYGPPLEEMRGRLAYLIARILSGAKPADLLIEQPNRLEFIANLKTAKTLASRFPRRFCCARAR